MTNSNAYRGERGRTKVQATITTIVRRQNTASGNPRFRLITPEGAFETKADAQVNHMISDRLIDRPRPLVELTLDGAGHVIALKEFPRSEA